MVFLMFFLVLAVAVVVSFIGGPEQGISVFGRRIMVILAVIALLITTAFFTIIVDVIVGVHHVDLKNIAVPEVIVLSLFLLRLSGNRFAQIKKIWGRSHRKEIL